MQTVIDAFSSAPTGALSSGINTSGFANPWNKALLSAVFGMVVVGTVGTVNGQLMNCVPSGAIQVRVLKAMTEGSVDSDRLVDTQEKLAGIGRYLSMNVTDIARALRVRRPTVYSWLRDEPSLRAAHAQRLEAVYQVARQWRAMSSQPVGEFLNRSLASGPTLLDLLSANTLNESAVSAGLARIREAIVRVPRPLRVVDVATQRGFKLSARSATNWASNEEIDM